LPLQTLSKNREQIDDKSLSPAKDGMIERLENNRPWWDGEQLDYHGLSQPVGLISNLARKNVGNMP